MNNSPMYHLTGYIVGQKDTFSLNISLNDSNNPEIHKTIDAMKQQIKEQNTVIQCASKQLKIYKIDEHPIHLPNSRFTEAQQEEGVPVYIIDKTDPQPKNFKYALLDGTRPITWVWSQQPDTAMKVHFMVMVNSNQALQVNVTLNIGLEEVCREVSVSLKRGSTIRDLLAKLRDLQLPARVAVDFYDAQGSAIEEDEQLIDGAIYHARAHPTPPATPIPPNSTRAVPYIYRPRAIKSILKELMFEKVVRICAPPACGKTSIAEQVVERYAFYFKDTYFIDLRMYLYCDPSTAQDQIFTNHAILLELDELARKQETTLIIIDEAQILNCIDEKHSFWGVLKRMAGHTYNKSLYILMLSVYGEGPSSIRTYNSILSSPITIPTLDFPTIYLDDEEFNAMVDRFNDHTIGIQLTGSCRDYIRNFLGGHIGLVTHLLKFLHKNLASHNLRKAIVQGSADEIQSLNFITQYALEDLMRIRSIPTISFLTASKVPYLLEVTQMLLLEGGFINKTSLGPRHDEAIAFLLTSFCITSNGIWWTFASPLIQFALLRTWRIPADRLADFHEFIQQCIQSLDYDKLAQIRSSSIAGVVVHEDPFKCALYAKMSSYLPLEHQVDPEVGRFFSSAGRVDLWIWPANWAIEILRNYNAVKAHVDRFSTTYSPLPIEKYIVLNFVQEQDPTLQLLTIRALSREQEQEQKNVWHVHWSPDARHIVLRRNTDPAESLPIPQKPLAIKPATICIHDA